MSAGVEPERLTEAEWQAKKARDDCAMWGHRPEVFPVDMSSGTCVCGAVEWTPVRR